MGWLAMFSFVVIFVSSILYLAWRYLAHHPVGQTVAVNVKTIHMKIGTSINSLDAIPRSIVFALTIQRAPNIYNSTVFIFFEAIAGIELYFETDFQITVITHDAIRQAVTINIKNIHLGITRLITLTG